jgi:hypothetical protein
MVLPVLIFLSHPVARAGMIRDLAALNRVEALPWDDRGLIPAHYDTLTEADRELLDGVAAVSAAGGPLPVSEAAYVSDPRLPARPTRADRRVCRSPLGPRAGSAQQVCRRRPAARLRGRLRQRPRLPAPPGALIRRCGPQPGSRPPPPPAR